MGAVNLNLLKPLGKLGLGTGALGVVAGGTHQALTNDHKKLDGVSDWTKVLGWGGVGILGGVGVGGPAGHLAANHAAKAAERIKVGAFGAPSIGKGAAIGAVLAGTLLAGASIGWSLMD